MRFSSLFYTKSLSFYFHIKQEKRYSIPLKEERIALLFSGSVIKDYRLKFLLLVWNNEFITLTVDVNNLNLWVWFQMLTQLSDINVH